MLVLVEECKMMWIAEYTCIILCDALWQMKFGRCCEIEKLIVATEQRNPLPEPGDTHMQQLGCIGKGGGLDGGRVVGG